MEEHLQPLFFEEEQSFPLWIRTIVLLPVVGAALGCSAILMWSFMEADAGLVRMLFAALALLTLVVLVACDFCARLAERLKVCEHRCQSIPLPA
jgi:hypothetical protein